VFPHDIDDEVEQGDDVEGAELCSWRFAPDEYVEEFEPDGMALDIESRVIMSIRLSNSGTSPKRLLVVIPLLQILDICDTFLRIAHHLPEEVCEACLAQFLRSTPVQRPVVYRLSVCRVFKTRCAALPRGRLAAHRLGGL
jgi:hypothetical protein